MLLLYKPVVSKPAVKEGMTWYTSNASVMLKPSSIFISR